MQLTAFCNLYCYTLSPRMSRTFSTNGGSLDSLKWLQTKGTPDARDDCLRYAHFARHGACAPMGCTGWGRFKRPGNHRINTRIIDAARGARTRCIEQIVQTLLDKASTSLGHHLWCYPLARSPPCCQHRVSASQHDARLQGQRPRRLVAQRQCHELFTFRFAQHQLHLESSSHRLLRLAHTA